MFHFKQCPQCGDWVDTEKRHVTAIQNGVPIYLHHDWCAEVYVEEVSHVHEYIPGASEHERRYRNLSV